MIQFKIFPEKDLFKIVDKRRGNKNLKYRLTNIALVRFEFFDDNETEGYISVYLKTDIEEYNRRFQELNDRFPDVPVTIDEIIEHKEGLLENCFSYKNQIDLSGESDIEFDLHGLFSELIGVCVQHKIEVITPDLEISLAARYFNWVKQEEAIEWWKDDFIFRYIFSKN